MKRTKFWTLLLRMAQGEFGTAKGTRLRVIGNVRKYMRKKELWVFLRTRCLGRDVRGGRDSKSDEGVDRLRFYAGKEEGSHERGKKQRAGILAIQGAVSVCFQARTP